MGRFFGGNYQVNKPFALLQALQNFDFSKDTDLW